MQRHKRSLDFLESPFLGGRRYYSPVLAARRPYLAPSVLAEELNKKWVSPQFQGDAAASPTNKRPKRRTRKQKPKTNQGESSKENAELFPKLNFISKTGYQNNNDKVSKTKTVLRKEQSDNMEKPSKKDGSYFLFSLGSPKTPVVPGEILVKETPNEQIGRKWTKRLRPRKIV